MDQVRAFVTVAHGLTYGRAAELLNLTEAGVHYQVKSMERLLGVRLLHRHGRTVQLTAQGREMLPAAELLVLAAEQLSWGVAGDELRPLRVAAGQALGPYVIAPILDEAKWALQRKIDLVVLSPGHALEAMCVGQVDLVMAAQEDIELRAAQLPEAAWLETVVVGKSPWVSIRRRAPAESSAARECERVVLTAGPEYAYRHVLRLFALGVLPRMRVDRVDSLAAVFALVSNDNALGLVPLVAIAREAQFQEYEVQPLRPSLEATTVIAYLPSARVGQEEALMLAHVIRGRLDPGLSS